MSKVKFIQLSAASKSQYDTKLADAQSSYPGAIIFVTYTDDTDNNKQKQEIWANGTKYEVGGGAGNVVYGDVPVNANGVAEGYTGSEGSIYVYTGQNTQTAYYWKGNKWNPFNVDAENVWFPKGIQRTALFGTKSAETDIQTEAVGYNLKDLFEYYLVEEIFPNVEPIEATANTGSYSIDMAIPNTALSSYMNKTSTLAEVGTHYTFKGLSLTENATHDGEESYTGTSSSIPGIQKYGYKTQLSDTSLSTAELKSKTPSIKCTYESNFTTAKATVSIKKVKGFNGISDATDESKVVDSQEEPTANVLTLAAQTGKVIHGSNQLRLSWSNTAYVTRSFSNQVNAEAIQAYYASNKGNTDSDHFVSIGEVTWTTITDASDKTYTASSFSVTGVYPLYTNGVEQDVTNTSGSWTSGEIDVTNGDTTTTVKGTKLSLYNYISSTRKIYYIGAGNRDDKNPLILYIPEASGITNVSAASYNTTKPAGQVSSYDSGAGSFNSDGVVTINGVNYVKWVNSVKFGAQNIKISIS